MSGSVSVCPSKGDFVGARPLPFASLIIVVGLLGFTDSLLATQQQRRNLKQDSAYFFLPGQRGSW